ncbi:MAG: hypothetical protein IT185_08715 [Acidobacteria bacterium]|nr:hypothetical protein [Acidobacteriota bacterium]
MVCQSADELLPHHAGGAKYSYFDLLHRLHAIVLVVVGVIIGRAGTKKPAERVGASAGMKVN